MKSKRRDRYVNFEQLKEFEREGVDYQIRCTLRKSPVAIIAPHGGGIEPGTSQIATAIAAADYSLYCFEGLKPKDNFKILHIESPNFNEPTCVDLVKSADYVVAVHGLEGGAEFVDVGGLDTKLRDAICSNLKSENFVAKVVARGAHAGVGPCNICNRNRRRLGAQLEITKGLRNVLMAQPQRMTDFAFAVREAILDQIGE